LFRLNFELYLPSFSLQGDLHPKNISSLPSITTAL
jgi:hypothetical protein